MVAPVTQEEILLAILMRHPRLRQHFRNYPESLFAGSLDREIFRRWLHEDTFMYREDDPVAERARALQARRLPPLSEAEAKTAADEKIREILRERIILHQSARAEDLAEAERTMGANHIAEVALNAWRGGMPGDEDRELAEALIEELQLGLSIHRKEAPGTH